MDAPSPRLLAAFIRSIAILAANADEQRGWLSALAVPEVESSAHELALEFNDGFRLATQWVDAGWLPARDIASKIVREL